VKSASDVRISERSKIVIFFSRFLTLCIMQPSQNPSVVLGEFMFFWNFQTLRKRLSICKIYCKFTRYATICT